MTGIHKNCIRTFHNKPIDGERRRKGENKLLIVWAITSWNIARQINVVKMSKNQKGLKKKRNQFR